MFKWASAPFFVNSYSLTNVPHLYNEMMVIHVRVNSKQLLEDGAAQMHEIVWEHTIGTFVVGWTPKYITDGLEKRCDILICRHLPSKSIAIPTGVGLEPLKSVQK